MCFKLKILSRKIGQWFTAKPFGYHAFYQFYERGELFDSIFSCRILNTKYREFPRSRYWEDLKLHQTLLLLQLFGWFKLNNEILVQEKYPKVIIQVANPPDSQPNYHSRHLNYKCALSYFRNSTSAWNAETLKLCKAKNFNFECWVSAAPLQQQIYLRLNCITIFPPN